MLIGQSDNACLLVNLHIILEILHLTALDYGATIKQENVFLFVRIGMLLLSLKATILIDFVWQDAILSLFSTMLTTRLKYVVLLLTAVSITMDKILHKLALLIVLLVLLDL